MCVRDLIHVEMERGGITCIMATGISNLVMISLALMCDNTVLDFKMVLRLINFYYSLATTNVPSNENEEYVKG